MEIAENVLLSLAFGIFFLAGYWVGRDQERTSFESEALDARMGRILEHFRSKK